ncbi:MAG: hypothetical protein J5819_00320 [Eubacterium sp.]|nr:hypothetical protein [Eubacterium sp.]
MTAIALILMVAIVCEALVEYFKTIMKLIGDGDYKTAITQGVTIFLGIGLAFVFHLHLFNDALSQFYPDIDIDQTVDTILTGILFSRGSNYFSDLIKRLTNIDKFNPDDIQIMVGDGTDKDEFLNGGGLK